MRKYLLNTNPRKPLINIITLALLVIAIVLFFKVLSEFRPNKTNKISSGLNTEKIVDIEIPFEEQDIKISPEISKKFNLSQIKNIDEMKKAYGVTFSQNDLNNLGKNKFIIKNLTDSNLTPVDVAEGNMREFVALYSKVVGSTNYKERTGANAVFISSDVLTHLFSVLSVELLKETENSYLFDQLSETTKILFEQSAEKVKNTRDIESKKEWIKVRNYFAVPYSILSTIEKPVTAQNYYLDGVKNISLDEAILNYNKKDQTIDTIENTISFIKNLKLDSKSESEIISDLNLIYEASQNTIPNIYKEEFEALTGKVKVLVPFSIFKPRGSYTSSSIRRQYFRSVQWYQQIPFLMLSNNLNKYALNIASLMNKNQNLLDKYNSMSSLLSVLVGKSDDLDVGDFAQAQATLGKDVNDSNKLNQFLDSIKPTSRIKSLPVEYSNLGNISIDETMKSLKGMRFFSQKFIPDSYWTGKLTQGDEIPAVDGMKLPKDTSSLEVMSILGSNYAQSRLVDLVFYKDHKKAIDTRMADLKSEYKSWGEKYYKSNQVTGILWTISGLFDWLQNNKTALPEFMQSPMWDVKTLMTGSAFWSELRHTNILYAKQSFAEKGGGGDDVCDTRKVPEPVVGYVEPQIQAYDRLYYTARLLNKEYTIRGIELKNLTNLQKYIELLKIVREYTKLELENTKYTESVISKTSTKSDDIVCNEELISGISQPEQLRLEIFNKMKSILPVPVEGEILPIKDKRSAVIADIHTSENGILEQGTGVPRLIFVAVRDINGPRLTVGFTYSHYEFLSDERLTDEEWQTNFYESVDDDYRINYKNKKNWPTLPLWYQKLLGTK